MSADGTLVAFQSHASNLVGTDPNPNRDVFVKVLTTGEVERPPWEPVEGPYGASFEAQLSPDGRFVLYNSGTKLVPGDNNTWCNTDDNCPDPYLYDRLTGQLTLISAEHGGTSESWGLLWHQNALTENAGAILIAARFRNNPPDRYFLVGGATPGSFYSFSPEDQFGDRAQAGFASDPVNTASGNFIQEEKDLEFPKTVFGLDWGRWYNSGDDTAGPLGRGWKVGHEVEVLGEDAEGIVTVRLADGRQVPFEPDGSGGYLRPDDFYGSLTAETDGSFRIDLFDGSSWDFNTSGLLLSMSNWEGQSVTLTYGANGLETVTNSTSGSLAISYDASGRMSQVDANDGRSVSYEYDAAGLLSSVTDSEGGVISHSYDTDGRLTEVFDPTGTLVVRNTYDGAHRVTSQETAGGVTASFDYGFAPGETQVTTQPSGEVTVYRHDAEGRLIGMVDAFGHEVDLTRQGDGELTGATSRLGESLTQSFDDNGNLLSSGSATGGTALYSYDSLNRLISVTVPSGAATTYAYQGSDRIPSMITDDDGNVTSYVVTDGLVESVTDPDGVTTTYTYDTERLLVATTDGEGNATSYSYDAAGWVTSLTSPEGNVTSFTYDSKGRLLTSTDPTGGLTTYTYDTAGRVLTVTDPGGALTTNTYDSVGRLESTTDSRGAVTTYDYDAFDQVIATNIPGGATTSNAFGDLGRIISTTDPVGRSTSFGYDADGNQTTVTDPLENVTTTQRDTSGRVTSVTDPLGRTTTNSYDPTGRLQSVTDPEGGVTSYTYDALGRVETVTDPRGGVTATSYTSGGRVETVSDPTGLTTAYSYDSAGLVATITDPEGGVISYGYDSDGNPISVTTPDGLTTTTTHDAAGRPLVTTDPAGVSTTRTYDPRGSLATVQRDGDGTISFNSDNRNLLDVSDALGNTTTFDYDDRGNRTSTTDALGRASTATFNDADQITTVTDALGRTTTTSYDDAGRLETIADPSGREVTNNYDAAGHLISQTFVDGTTISYSYDNAGRRTSMTDPSGTTGYTYDSAGNLTSVTYPDGSTLDYTHDAAGRRSQVTYPDGSSVDYTYDDTGQIVSATHSTGGTATYTYDADGRLTSEALPDGTTRSYTYTNGRLISYTQNEVTTSVSYDTSGRIATTSGGEDWTFGYDEAGQLVTADRGGDSFAYGYDPVGNLTSITDPSGQVSFTVDDANQLATISEGTSYKYDDVGRLVHEATAGGYHRILTYDVRGLLVTETIIDLCSTLTPTIVGTEGDDIINGTNGDDIIFAVGGNNVIDGGRGNDIICGGPGNDTITGGHGDDIIFAGGGDNVIHGNQGDDIIIGGPGNDQLFGDQHNDILIGGPGINSLNGGSGTDACSDDPDTVNCQNPRPDPLPIPGATIIQRSYDGDGFLTNAVITHPDGEVDAYSMIWDRTLPIPQVVSLTHNGTTSQLVYGPNRAFAVEGNTATSFDYSVLGDTTSGSHTIAISFDPYGNPDTPNLTVGFGYRGELHVAGLIHLRNRDLDPKLGRFTTTDPLTGVPGTTTLTNQYHYADNDPIGLEDPLGLRARDRDLVRLVPNMPVDFIDTPSSGTSAACLLPSAINWCQLRPGPSMWQLEPWIIASANRYLIDPFVLAAIIFHEGGAIRLLGDSFRHLENAAEPAPKPETVGIGQINPVTAQMLIEERFSQRHELTDLRAQLVFNDQFSIEVAGLKVASDIRLLSPRFTEPKYVFTAYGLGSRSIETLVRHSWNLGHPDVEAVLRVEITRRRLQDQFPRAWQAIINMWEFGGFLSPRSPGDYRDRHLA